MNFPAAAEIVETAKAIRPSAVTAMGGPHVTFDAENTLRTYPGTDLLVLGEGERTVAEFLPLTHDREAWSQVKGIAFLEDGRFVRTGARELIQDLETIPRPARHLLPVSRYQALRFPVSIITSRGWPYQCIFCQGRRMVGLRDRYRNPMSVVDEIEEVLAYGFTRRFYLESYWLAGIVYTSILMFVLAAVPSKALPPILGNAGEVIFIYGFIMAEKRLSGKQGVVGKFK